MKKIVCTVVKTFTMDEEPFWKCWGEDETPENISDEEAVFRIVEGVDSEKELKKMSDVYSYKMTIARDDKIIYVDEEN